ncbi:alpha/beta hydrolase family protein [Zunongwangia sp. HGR-M22]|uniref:alpha/beta hydrolase family protein n=1 Tax=Zunongwangia sp. HGR-M22 TaxID=3015168 RepID=UPI0022DE003E|nr:prolyl oligopeptidase family serine peptidase [Zunongwangia sp. HGR-M22]WBL24341.1 prolyl oligopeptidase family serine peptidase [Zunongwangia sp. HGR-M22]
MQKTILILTVVLLSLQSLFSQKQEVDSTAYKQWKRIEDEKISNNGNWIAYRKVFQDPSQSNSADVYVVDVNSGKERKLERIYEFEFVGTGDWSFYTTDADIFLYNLKTEEKRTWKVAAYTQNLEGTDYLFYTEYETSTSGENSQKLVFYDLKTNKSTEIEQVKNFKLLDNNDIIYAQQEGSKIYLRYSKIKGESRVIYEQDADKFGNFMLVNNTEGTFTIKLDNGDEILYHFNLKENTKHAILNFSDILINNADYEVSNTPYSIDSSDKYMELQLQPNFNKYGNAPKKNEAVDIWKWDEGTMARRQWKLRGDKEIPNDPVYFYDIENKKTTKLLDGDEYSMILKSPHVGGDIILYTDNRLYTKDVDWTFGQNNDIYGISIKTKEKFKLAESTTSIPSWNDQGTLAVIFDNNTGNWKYLDARSAQPEFKTISEAIPYSLTDQETDMGNTKTPYGIAGWLNDGTTPVFYGKYDLWAVNLEGEEKGSVYSLTNGYGRKHKVSFRLQGADFKQNLDVDSLLFIGFNNDTKSTGVYRLKNNEMIALAANEDYNIEVVKTAANGDYLFTKESYTTFPNLWHADHKFQNEKKLTDINSQIENYKWGNAKLISWQNFDQNANEGLLYLPDNYDASKTYPVIVHFYEKHSGDLHHYVMPEWSTCNINIPTYLSKDYIVFQPDVHFTYGEPGESAYNSIISGVEHLIEKGITEKGKIGIQGHSFAGFETSYLVTHSDIFTCAIVGSGVSNFTNNYLSYRSNGLSTMFKYEVDQYRMKGSLFEYTQDYIKNSPIFNVKNISTPILIFHNEDDLSVPFEQGMQLFFALRRNNKPSWLINYTGENHTLSKEANQKDWTFRMQAYFDKYLKNKDSNFLN